VRNLALIPVIFVALSACGGLDLLRGGFGGGEGYVATRVCGLYVDGKTRAAHLRLELVPGGRLPRGALIEAEFENPEGGAPVTASRVFKGEQTLVIFSPPVKGLRVRNYEVVARIYAAADKQQVLGVHTQICQALVDPKELS
jgi:hypothetical protein